jgi:hypothetical protein
VLLKSFSRKDFSGFIFENAKNKGKGQFSTQQSKNVHASLCENRIFLNLSLVETKTQLVKKWNLKLDCSFSERVSLFSSDLICLVFPLHTLGRLKLNFKSCVFRPTSLSAYLKSTSTLIKYVDINIKEFLKNFNVNLNDQESLFITHFLLCYICYCHKYLCSVFIRLIKERLSHFKYKLNLAVVKLRIMLKCLIQTPSLLSMFETPSFFRTFIYYQNIICVDFNALCDQVKDRCLLHFKSYSFTIKVLAAFNFLLRIISLNFIKHNKHNTIRKTIHIGSHLSSTRLDSLILILMLKTLLYFHIQSRKSRRGNNSNNFLWHASSSNPIGSKLVSFNQMWTWLANIDNRSGLSRDTLGQEEAFEISKEERLTFFLIIFIFIFIFIDKCITLHYYTLNSNLSIILLTNYHILFLFFLMQ